MSHSNIKGRDGAAVAGVVLAAGTGRRMGRPKALIPLDGQPLVIRAVDALRAGGCRPLAVVVGAGAGSVRPLVPADAQVIDNPGWEGGMGSSVLAALAWAHAGTGAGEPPPAALLVLPVDTPGIGPAVVRQMLDRWDGGGRDPSVALVATYGGRRRNPVLLPAGTWSDVAARVHGDSGARPWLQDNPDRVINVDCTSLGDPTDLDTPDDLDRWVRRAAGPEPADPPQTAATPGEQHGT